MADKINEIKEKANDFVSDHQEGFIVGVYVVVSVATIVGSFIWADRSMKKQARLIGKEVAKNLMK